MTGADWRDLAVRSVTDPAAAARALIDLHLEREALWTGLALAVVLNTFLHTLWAAAIPQTEALPQLLSSPVVYGGVMGGSLLMSIIAVFQVGRLMGGQGSFADVMVVMVWLQFLQVAVQAAELVLILTLPALSVLLILAAGAVGIYIFLHFVDQAHRLGSIWRAAGVSLAAMFAIALAIYLILTLAGGPISGSSPYV